MGRKINWEKDEVDIGKRNKSEQRVRSGSGIDHTG